MTTNMIRADIDLRSFYRWAGSRGMISRNAFDPGFAMHCLLTESFGRDLAPKPFRVIIPRDRNRPPGTFYAYSASPAEELRDTAQTFACPLQSKILPPSSIDGKTMPDTWRTGQRLGFEVLIRPVVRLHKDCSRVPPDRLRRFKVNRPREGEPEMAPRPGKECDVFLWEAVLHSEKGRMKRSREEVYAEWLSARLAQRGARLEEARLRSFQRVRVVRKLRKHASEGPDAVMQGTLEVTDPAEFAKLVADGVGRHRAYGYGMLLLRPPSRLAG